MGTVTTLMDFTAAAKWCNAYLKQNNIPENLKCLVHYIIMDALHRWDDRVEPCSAEVKQALVSVEAVEVATRNALYADAQQKYTALEAENSQLRQQMSLLDAKLRQQTAEHARLSHLNNNLKDEVKQVRNKQMDSDKERQNQAELVKSQQTIIWQLRGEVQTQKDLILSLQSQLSAWRSRPKLPAPPFVKTGASTSTAATQVDELEMADNEVDVMAATLVRTSAAIHQAKHNKVVYSEMHEFRINQLEQANDQMMRRTLEISDNKSKMEAEFRKLQEEHAELHLEFDNGIEQIKQGWSKRVEEANGEIESLKQTIVTQRDELETARKLLEEPNQTQNELEEKSLEEFIHSVKKLWGSQIRMEDITERNFNDLLLQIQQNIDDLQQYATKCAQDLTRLKKDSHTFKIDDTEGQRAILAKLQEVGE